MDKYSLSSAEYVMLEYAKRFHTHSKIDDFQQFWKYKYDVNPIELIQSLIDKNLLREGSIATSVEHLTIPKLKQILKENNLPCSGNKDVLVKRILSEIDCDVLNTYFPYRYYELTETGEQYKNSSNFENALWVHRHPNYDVTVSEIGDKSPNEYAIMKFKKLSKYYADREQWGLYRNTRCDIAELLKAENYTEYSFTVYIEVCVLDIAIGIAALPDVPPGIINQLRKLASDLGYLDNEYLLLSNILAAINNIPIAIKYDNVNDVALFLKEKIIDITYEPPENLQINTIICQHHGNGKRNAQQQNDIQNLIEDNSVGEYFDQGESPDSAISFADEDAVTVHDPDIEKTNLADNIEAETSEGSGCLLAIAAIYFSPLILIAIILFMFNCVGLGILSLLVYVMMCFFIPCMKR